MTAGRNSTIRLRPERDSVVAPAGASAKTDEVVWKSIAVVRAAQEDIRIAAEGESMRRIAYASSDPLVEAEARDARVVHLLRECVPPA